MATMVSASGALAIINTSKIVLLVNFSNQRVPSGKFQIFIEHITKIIGYCWMMNSLKIV